MSLNSVEFLDNYSGHIIKMTYSERREIIKTKTSLALSGYCFTCPPKDSAITWYNGNPGL